MKNNLIKEKQNDFSINIDTVIYNGIIYKAPITLLDLVKKHIELSFWVGYLNGLKNYDKTN